MLFCTFCGSPLPEDAAICPQCGQPVSPAAPAAEPSPVEDVAALDEEAAAPDEPTPAESAEAAAPEETAQEAIPTDNIHEEPAPDCVPSDTSEAPVQDSTPLYAQSAAPRKEESTSAPEDSWPIYARHIPASHRQQYNPGSRPEPSEPDQAPTTGQYFVMQFLMSLPIVGLIISLIWAFGSGEDLHHRNLARSNLILRLIRDFILTAAIVAATFVVSMMVQQMYYNDYYYYSSPFETPFDDSYGFYDFYGGSEDAPLEEPELSASNL